MKQLYYSIAVLLTICINGYGQVGIGTTTPQGALDISSSTNGMLVPRVALTSRIVAAPVVNPQGGGLSAGTLIWNTSTAGSAPNNVVPGFYFWNGSAWTPIAGSSSTINWATNGNAATNGGTITAPGTNFIGTTDAQNLDFRTNNTYVARFSRLGEFFIGTYNTVMPGDLMNAVGSTAFPWAVNGYTSHNAAGVFGQITGGNSDYGAVQGEYHGDNANGNGVRGIYDGNAIFGVRVGVRGASLTGIGNQQVGVLGEYSWDGWGLGVVGLGYNGAVPGGNNDIAVLGWTNPNFSFAGYFNGNTATANGTKSASVGTSKGNQLLYVVESPEVWFEDIGRGKLVNGVAEIKLDPLFLETVFIDDEHPMSVFLQEEGDSNGLYVVPGKDGFVVREKNGGQSNIAFSYRIMAKRLNFQDHRFGSDPIWGEGDTRKYNSYATPPRIDYNENRRQQEEIRKNAPKPELPPGFIRAEELHQKSRVSRPAKPAE